MPERQIGGKEDAGESGEHEDARAERAGWKRLADGTGEEGERQDGDRQPPECRGDRGDIGEADEPGAEGEGDAAEDHRGEGEAVWGCGHDGGLGGLG